MKKKLLLIAFVVICLSVITTGTLALFTAEETAHNVITTGNVNIAVVEKTLDGDGKEIAFPEEGFKNVMPGQSISKRVRIENVGVGDAWVRVQVTQELEDASGATLPPQITDAAGQKTDVLSMDYNQTDWLYADGFYYYTKPLKAEEFTTDLFRNVTFASQMGNEYKSGTIRILINAYAVQAANNPIPEDGTVADIPGWPDPT